MAMVVRTNINSMNANRNLSINNSQVATSLEKLASGYAINRAADDAAGLAITEKMRAQITGLDQGTENALDGVCLIQTAEGAMDEIHNMLNRMVELSTKSANGTIQDEVDREAIQAEIDVLISEIDRIAQATNYNGIPLLDGSLSGDGCSTTDGTTGNGSVELNIDISKSTTVGSFTVTGGVQGVDFDYNNTTGELTILTDTHMRIEGGSNTESIVVDDIAGSANLALCNVNITSSTGSAFYTGNNDVYIELEGDNVLSSIASSYNSQNDSYEGLAGLNVGEFGNLIIDGTGELNAAGSFGGAGIGGDYNSVSGNITINSGTITAISNGNGAGIGSGEGDSGYGGDITINGGTITAISNGAGAGIGSSCSGTAGDITITGGTIVATSDGNQGGIGGAGIGSGEGGDCGDILISGGDVIATGSLHCGVGIGSGLSGTAGDITYVEEIVTAIGGINWGGGDMVYTVDIGAGEFGTVGTITTIPLGTSDNTTCRDGLTLHVADENNPYNKIQIYVDSMRADDLGIDPLDVSTQDSAGACIDVIKNAINYVSTNRANLGALQNRLERTVNNNNNTSENMSSAVSTIKDTDMASEMMRYTTMNVLVQSAQSMLAQSNQAPQSILSLLG